jgi:DNA polymerase-1
MIFLVTTQQELFDRDDYKIISVEESLQMMKDWEVIQLDTETTGRDAHLCDLLCVQLGNDKADARIVVDTSTVDIKLYKDLLESKFFILHNAKFDLQFFFKHGIIIRKVYDTMIAEQVLYLGWPAGQVAYSLKEVAWRRLSINIDKTVRGEIIWRGLDAQVIQYAAGDVMHLEKIMWSQINDLKEKGMLEAARVECNFIPSLAYMEWCGILLDRNKWQAKMKNDRELLKRAKENLDNFVTSNPKYSEYTYINLQGDLWSGYDTTPKCTINWDSPAQVTSFFKKLGFNTSVQDKKTGEDKDSVLEKVLKGQKGINDEFLDIYFDYKEHSKVCSTYGQGHLNMINPKTGRIHTTFKQLGAASGRLSCGSKQPNTDLAKAIKVAPKECTYCNLQQLPADEPTRSAFVAPEGYNFVSADFSAEESRLGADIYQDKEFLKEFKEGSGDTHNMFAWIVYNDECKALGCKDATEVKKKAPKWRKAVKGFEFGYMFGAAAPTLAATAGCTVEEAQEVVNKLDKAFSGMTAFAKKGAAFVRSHGYIIINPQTGHRLTWWDWDTWKERQKRFNAPGFWDDFKAHHKGTGDALCMEVRHHFQAASKYDRLARNVVTQGTGAIILKSAMTTLFNWIVDNGYFNIIHICVAVHDEINCDYPKEVEDFPNILETIMEQAAAKYCKSLPIPAEASVSDHWIH